MVDRSGSEAGRIRLIVDGTKMGFGHQLLIVCMAFRRRAVAIAWTWVPYRRGHNAARLQVALLAYVQRLLPKGVRVLLVGDSEFGSVAVIRQVRRMSCAAGLRPAAHRGVECVALSDRQGPGMN